MAKKAAATPEVSGNDKKAALETVISRIEKECGKGSIMRLGESAALNVSAVSTGSLSLDFALGVGGIPRGRITEIYGPESSGKTTIALHVIAEVQRQGGEAAFIDAEHALDPSTRLEARFPYCREPAYCILSAYCILHIECSTFHSIIFQDLE